MNDDYPFPDLSNEPCAPPEPGRVDLVVTGDIAMHLQGVGVVYSGDFDISSNDVSGPGSEPSWALGYSDTLRLTVGRDDNEKHFRSDASSPGVRRVGDVFHVDALLAREEGGQVRVKGTVSVPREAAGTVPDDIAAILARETRSKAAPVREYGVAKVQVVEVPEEVRDLVEGVRAKLPPGWVAYVGEIGWATAKRKKMRVEVVVGPGREQWDIMRLAHVDATNWEMTVEGLIKKLRGFHERVGLDIWRADGGSVEADIERLPADLAAFAAEVYEFCPDTVDQGLETVDALAAQIRSTKRLSLWWD